MNEQTRCGDVSDVSFEVRFAELRQRFVERLRRDGEAVAGLRGRLDAGEPLAGELLRDLCRMAHGLSGAASIFGFDVVSEAAHRLEQCLRRYADAPADPLPLLDALQAEIAAALPA